LWDSILPVFQFFKNTVDLRRAGLVGRMEQLVSNFLPFPDFLPGVENCVRKSDNYRFYFSTVPLITPILPPQNLVLELKNKLAKIVEIYQNQKSKIFNTMNRQPKNFDN